MYQDAADIAAGVILANVDRQALDWVRERAFAHERVHEVGANFEHPALHFAHASGHDHEIKQVADNRDRDRDDEHRPNHDPAAEAGRKHDHQLAFDIKPVHRIEDREEQRERQDQRHQLRQRQHGEVDKRPHRLALIDYHVQHTQRLGQPDDPRQHERGEQKRAADLPEQVASNSGHGSFCTLDGRFGRFTMMARPGTTPRLPLLPVRLNRRGQRSTAKLVIQPLPPRNAFQPKASPCSR